jgi:hypothetical protein
LFEVETGLKFSDANPVRTCFTFRKVALPSSNFFQDKVTKNFHIGTYNTVRVTSNSDQYSICTCHEMFTM